MKKPKVSIIILNWNGWQDTLECLESLSKISYPYYEVIVVDNASEDDSVKKIKEWTKKKSIKNFSLIENKENYGFAKGNNIAIRQALKKKENDYVLLLNNDVIVDKNFLNELVKVAESKPKIGIIGSKIYFYPPKRKNIIQSCGAGMDLKTGRLVNYGDGEMDSKQFKKTKKVIYVYGASILIKREVLEKVGLFDEKFFAIAEDADLCLRAKKAGFLIYCAPQSKVWHKSEASIKKVPGFADYYRTRNLFWLEKKHASGAQYFSFLFYYFFSQLPLIIYRQYLKRKQFQLLKNYFRGIKDGVFG